MQRQPYLRLIVGLYCRPNPRPFSYQVSVLAPSSRLALGLLKRSHCVAQSSFEPDLPAWPLGVHLILYLLSSGLQSSSLYLVILPLSGVRSLGPYTTVTI